MLPLFSIISLQSASPDAASIVPKNQTKESHVWQCSLFSSRCLHLADWLSWLSLLLGKDFSSRFGTLSTPATNPVISYLPYSRVLCARLCPGPVDWKVVFSSLELSDFFFARFRQQQKKNFVVLLHRWLRNNIKTTWQRLERFDFFKRRFFEAFSFSLKKSKWDPLTKWILFYILLGLFSLNFQYRLKDGIFCKWIGMNLKRLIILFYIFIFF